MLIVGIQLSLIYQDSFFYFNLFMIPVFDLMGKKSANLSTLEVWCLLLFFFCWKVKSISMCWLLCPIIYGVAIWVSIIFSFMLFLVKIDSCCVDFRNNLCCFWLPVKLPLFLLTSLELHCCPLFYMLLMSWLDKILLESLSNDISVGVFNLLLRINFAFIQGFVMCFFI